MRRFITGFAAVVLLALPLHAQKVQEQMLVSPDWLPRRFGIVTVLHIGDAASYDARHIPRAVLIEMSSLLAQRNVQHCGALPPTSRLAGSLSEDCVQVVDPRTVTRVLTTP